MIRRVREQFGPQVANEYQAAHDGLMTSLTAIRDCFADHGLPLYAEFFDVMLIPCLESHDFRALLDALDIFNQRFNSFQQYQVLFGGEVERLHRIQQELED